MKTSELINDLTQLMNKYGDKEVVLNEDTQLYPVDECYFDRFNDIIVIAD